MREPGEGICALVMAAGAGSRYRQVVDQDKLLAPSLANASAAPSVLGAALTALRGIAERTVVIVQAGNQPLQAWLHKRAEALQIEVFVLSSTGLGDSLAQAAARFPARRGWLVALGDMPYIRSETVREIAAAVSEANLVVPTFDGRRGHPRGIGAAHWAAMLELQGQQGAQRLFSDYDVLELPGDDPGVLIDIDRPEDRLEVQLSTMQRI